MAQSVGYTKNGLVFLVIGRQELGLSFSLCLCLSLSSPNN